MEKLGYWGLVNFLLLKQNTLPYSCLTDTKLHVHVVNCTAFIPISGIATNISTQITRLNLPRNSSH